MSDSKKTRAGTAIPTRAVENGTVCETAQPSTTNDTISAAVRQRFQVEDFLEFGVKNARTLRYLKSILHQDGRTIRAEIEAARKSGVPIVSGQDGYWLTTDPAEIAVFCRSMRRRAAQIRLVAWCVERSVKDNRHP